MAAFSSAAFSTSAFSTGAFDFGDAAPAPTAAPSLGGKKDKKLKGPEYYPPHERLKEGARELADLREKKVRRILAERAAKEAVEKAGVNLSPATSDAPLEGQPVFMAGGVAVPPEMPPATNRLGDIAPELAALQEKLTDFGFDFEDDRRRRLLLLH